MNIKKSLILIFLLYLSKTSAANWNITGSGNWNVPGNWNPIGVPNSNLTDVDFGAVITGPATITVPGAFDIRNLTITAPGFSYTISGGTLNTTPAAGNGIAVTGVLAHTISSNLNLLSAYTITQGSTNPLTLSGAISGAQTIAKAGTGELILSGTNANTYSGLTTINAGTVTLSKTAGVNAIGDSVTINAGTLQYTQSEQIANTGTITIANAASVLNLNGQTETVTNLVVSAAAVATYNLNGTLNLSSTGTALSDATAVNHTLNGQINLTGGAGGSVSKSGAASLFLQNVGVQNSTHDFATTVAGATIDISGIVSGNGGLSKSGAGVLNFSGTAVNSYTGPTILNAGTVQLSRSAGLSIPGDITINAGTLLLNNAGNLNQIADTSNLTISGGTFNMNNFGETIASLTMTGGTIINNGGAGLTLNSTGTALMIRNMTIPGQLFLTGATGGNVVFDAANNGTAVLTNIDLGSAVRTFNIGQSLLAIDMDINGVVSGTGGITKIGPGNLRFTANSSNTYTGLTTVTQGILQLNKTNPFIAIPGNLLINGGTVQLTIANQIADTADVQIDSGTLDLNGFAETFRSLTFNGGTLNQGAGILSLNSTGTALTMRNTSVNGTINLTGATGGSVVFDSSSGGMAFINTLNLGTKSRTFNIAAGGDPSVKMVIQNSSGAGAAPIKDGPGILELIGTHTYTVATAQVLNGTLAVAGTMSAPAVAVSPGAILKGNGTVTSNLTLNGTLQPGSGIGTINLVGTQVFGPTGIFENEFNATTSDLVNITGSLNISSGAALTLVPLVSTFSVPSTYTIIQTTTGVTGQFTTVNNPLLFYSANVIYNPNSVLLQIVNAPFSNVVNTGNAGVVARYLDGLTIPPGSDLAFIVNSLRQLNSAKEVQNALLQMQPSHLKGLALSQENNALRIESYILDRMQSICCPPPCQSNVWVLVAGDFYHQDHLGQEVSFQTNSTEVVLGVDTHPTEPLLIGLAGAYSYSDIDWNDKRGFGHINSGSLGIYGNWKSDCFLINGLVLGAYNAYEETRRIRFATINRKAHGSIDGGQLLGSLDFGYDFCICSIEVIPYLKGDWMYLYLGNTREHGANSLNLHINSSNYSLFRGQVGLNLSHCFTCCCNKFGTSLDLSYIREQRPNSKTFTASFEGFDSTFTVKGMKPNRNAFSPQLTLSYISDDDRFKLGAGYSAEIGQRYFDQNFYLQAVIGF